MHLVKKVLCFSAIAAAALLTATSSAHAQTNYLFDITGDDNFEFTLPANPTPDVSGAGGFWIENIPGFSETSDGTAWAVFYSSTFNGGLELYDPVGNDVFYAADSQQLYTGPTSDPTFTLGTYTMNSANYGFGNTTLTISELTAVPEPAGWALMIAGLGLTGVALRRRYRMPVAATL